jgi:uncharacterized membrane protein SirB2
MLMIHFLGLVMGLGTSFALLFLGRAGSKMEKEEGRKFMRNVGVLSRMGHIGLTMLILSGLYLITPYWKTLNARPFLIAKLILVLLLTGSVAMIGIYSNRAKRGDAASNQKKIAFLGKMALFLGIGIVVLAVLNFR